MARTTCSCRLNSSEDYNKIYHACKPVTAQWKTLATYLNINRPTVNTIKEDEKNANDRLMQLLETWLKTITQPHPSWRVLCKALSHLDGDLSERLAQKHPSCEKCRKNQAIAEQLH